MDGMSKELAEPETISLTLTRFLATSPVSLGSWHNVHNSTGCDREVFAGLATDSVLATFVSLCATAPTSASAPLGRFPETLLYGSWIQLLNALKPNLGLKGAGNDFERLRLLHCRSGTTWFWANKNQCHIGVKETRVPPKLPPLHTE